MYLIYRPYIYKALHEPDAVTTEDLEGCKAALLVCSIYIYVRITSNFKYACTSWPLVLPMFQSCKRLIPHIYEYSHMYALILSNPDFLRR